MSETNTAQIRRAKDWQLILAPLSSSVPTIFVVLMTFASYAATGVYGVATVLAGTIISGTRIFDAITDPLIALICDRFVSKFGKCRTFMVVGWLVMCASVFAMFNLGLGGGEGIGSVLMFILIYMVYIIGYTIFGVGSNLVQPIMTEDPKQRASLGRWQAVYSTVVSSCFSIVLAKTLMPKHGGKLGLPLFADLSTLVICVTGVMILGTIIVVTLAKVDVPETYEGKTKKPVSMKDIWDMIIHSRPLQMYIVAAASDKLALQTASQSAINVMIFGIILGNYGFSGTLTFINMFVTLALLLFVVARLAGKSGHKEANVLWTSIAIAAYAAMWIYLMMIDTRSMLDSSVLKTIFIILFCAMGASKMAVSAVSPPMRADIVDYELYRTGKYMPATVNAAYSFVDKLISSLASTVVALSVAAIGYTSGMPQVADTLTPGLFWVGTFLWLGMPMLGYVCTLIAMKFYKLDKETMAEVRKQNAEMRAEKKNA